MEAPSLETPIHPIFYEWHSLLQEKYNLVIVIKAGGERSRRIGKSMLGLNICMLYDPDFTVDKVIYQVPEILVPMAKGRVPSGSFVMVDEGARALQARRSMRNDNVEFSTVVEVSGIKMVSWVVIATDMDKVDVNMERDADYIIDVIYRGFAHVYRKRRHPPWWPQKWGWYRTGPPLLFSPPTNIPKFWELYNQIKVKNVDDAIQTAAVKVAPELTVRRTRRR